jgi:hypothetical protein
LAVIELISLPILLVLLLFFFKSVVAALVPLGIAVATVLGAFAIARFLTHFVVIDSYAVNVITILGSNVNRISDKKMRLQKNGNGFIWMPPKATRKGYNAHIGQYYKIIN